MRFWRKGQIRELKTFFNNVEKIIPRGNKVSNLTDTGREKKFLTGLSWPFVASTVGAGAFSRTKKIFLYKKFSCRKNFRAQKNFRVGWRPSQSCID